MTDDAQTATQWAIDYQDGYGPRPSQDEWTARNWVEYWNARREDQGPAVLMRREVITTDWTAA